MMSDKRLKIVLGYSVADETDNTPFFDCGIVYRDAPLPVLQTVHEVMLKHGPRLLEALAPIAAELTEMGYAVAELQGVPTEMLTFVKDRFGNHKEKK